MGCKTRAYHKVVSPDNMGANLVQYFKEMRTTFKRIGEVRKRHFPFFNLLVGISLLLGACGQTMLEPTITPMPPGYIPTAAALTLQAQGFGLTPTLTSQPSERESTGVEMTEGNEATSTQTPPLTLPSTTSTPEASFTPTATWTVIPETLFPPSMPIPQIPEARIQIYQLGALSRVTSPFPVIARLTSRIGKVARVELFGEDGRLLARYLQTYTTLPWNTAKISIEMSFEISAAAELGRLVISVEDAFGRLMDLNSLDLILLSEGYTELNPPTALYQTIVIQEPAEDSLILGGVVYVSGVARPSSDLPLRVSLIAEDGRILGQRLAGVFNAKPGEYGYFFAEVPYAVQEITPVRLVVYEEGGIISDMTHLSSVLILLGP